MIYEVIVIGAGIEGSATGYYLTSRGTKNVLMLEQFDALHTRGSSHGGSRITRRAYYAAIFVHMMKEAYPLWEEIEQRSGKQLYWKSGVLAIGRKGQPGLDLYIESLNENGVPYDLLTGEEANRRYPQQLKLPSDCWCIYEADGGVLKASLALKTLQELFVHNGGQLLDCHKVTGLLPGPVVTVETDKGSFKAKKVIVTAGAWANDVLKTTGLTLPMKVYRAEVFYFKVEDPDAYSVSNFPVFLNIHNPVTKVASIYGTPILEYPGLLKVCQFFGEDLEIHPESRDSIPHGLTLPRVSDYIVKHFKRVSTIPSIFELCLYADTPDNNPYLDKHPDYPNIVIGAGFSHGFKMSPVFGKILSELALGHSPSYDLTLFKIDRFETPKAAL